MFSTLLPLVQLGLLFLFMLVMQQCAVRVLARIDGFKSTRYNLSTLGPILHFWRWGSVCITGWAWGRTVKITAFQHHIHLKLISFMGGGEILLPLENATYSFSSTIRGEIVKITLAPKVYTLGAGVAKLVREQYL